MKNDKKDKVKKESKKVEKKKRWDDDKYFYEPWDASLDEPMTEEEQKALDQELDAIWA